jgi:2,3-dihydroxybiphenyl 1,2-dioxygenase
MRATKPRRCEVVEPPHRSLIVQHSIELGYLGVEVSDRRSFGDFLAATIGLVPGDANANGATSWRNDHKAQRILVNEGPANDAHVVGFEASNAEAYESARAQLDRAGYPTTTGTADDRAARRVADLAHVDAPWGMRVEVVHSLAEAPTPFLSPLVPGGFLTEDVGFGHVVVATEAFDDSLHFVTEGLGMRQSDWVETEIAGGVELEIRFYHCNARHHSLALARAPFNLPAKLHHVMFEVNDRDDVGRAFDRAWDAELGIASGLGCHDNDGMFSFYVVSPAGFQVEIGYGGRRIGPDWNDNRRYDRISIWGHQSLLGTRP